MSFTHKVVAITGGGTGMGRAVAQAFLERGARIVINGRRADVLEAASSQPRRQFLLCNSGVGELSSTPDQCGPCKLLERPPQPPTRRPKQVSTH